MITTLVVILHVIVCLVLIFVILVQGGRGQGITGPSFGSGNVQSLFGTRAADFLTKATSVSAICFLFTCIALNIIETRKSKSLLEASRPAAPVDVDAIRKALEKVKEGKPVEPVVQGGALPVQGSADAQAAVNKLVAEAQTKAVEAQTAAAGAVSAATTAATATTAAASGDAQKKS